MGKTREEVGAKEVDTEGVGLEVGWTRERDEVGGWGATGAKEGRGGASKGNSP